MIIINACIFTIFKNSNGETPFSGETGMRSVFAFAAIGLAAAQASQDGGQASGGQVTGWCENSMRVQITADGTQPKKAAGALEVKTCGLSIAPPQAGLSISAKNLLTACVFVMGREGGLVPAKQPAPTPFPPLYRYQLPTQIKIDRVFCP